VTLLQRNTVSPWLIIGFIFLVKGYFLFNTFNHGNFGEAAILKSGDAGHYFKIAKNLNEFQSYADNNSALANESATWRPPIWPLVLSLLFCVSTNPFILLILKTVFESLLIISALWYFSKKNNYSFLQTAVLLLLLIEPQYLKYAATFLSESFTAVLALLLTLLFLGLNKAKSFHLLIPVIAGLTVLCHPVSVFFVVTLFSLYLLFNLKKDIRKCFWHGLLFSLIVLSWPIRNALVFDQGIYLTASQGATFAKGWNEKVLTDFTNVDGDLADESLNLKYIDSTELNENKGILGLSKLYQKGTWHYLKSLTFTEQANIALKKLKSNFNPFPEKPKAGFFETLAIGFRILYLVVFVQLLFRITSRKRIDFSSQRDKAFIVVFAILVGQTLMSIYIYTGFRFNSVYSLTLLFCFLTLNQGWILDKIKSILRK
jgi:hypothetical protein